jgi:hypothetical protein
MPGWRRRSRARRTCWSCGPRTAGWPGCGRSGPGSTPRSPRSWRSSPGFLISDGYGAYQDLLPQLAGVQQCCQHIIRRCRAVTRLGPGGLQSWAGDVIDVLREAHQAVEAALARGDPALDGQLLDKLRQRYDEAVAFGVTHNRLRARWCRIPSYLDSAANPGLTALDAITRALAGDPWLPAQAA